MWNYFIIFIISQDPATLAGRIVKNIADLEFVVLSSFSSLQAAAAQPAIDSLADRP